MDYLLGVFTGLFMAIYFYETVVFKKDDNVNNQNTRS